MISSLTVNANGLNKWTCRFIALADLPPTQSAPQHLNMRALMAALGIQSAQQNFYTWPSTFLFFFFFCAFGITIGSNLWTI